MSDDSGLTIGGDSWTRKERIGGPPEPRTGRELHAERDCLATLLNEARRERDDAIREAEQLREARDEALDGTWPTYLVARAVALHAENDCLRATLSMELSTLHRAIPIAWARPEQPQWRIDARLAVEEISRLATRVPEQAARRRQDQLLFLEHRERVLSYIRTELETLKRFFASHGRPTEIDGEDWRQAWEAVGQIHRLATSPGAGYVDD